MSVQTMRERVRRATRIDAGTAGYAAAVAGVLFIAAFLRFWQLGQGGLGNPFYAATVRSMTHSLHNFFFASFDPLGTFMVDKPPLAFWLQTTSARVLGYDGFALVLPQALAGVAGVVLLFVAVRWLQGDFAAFSAAAALAVMPASVLVSRNNTMDTIVMALSLAAAVLALRSAAGGRILPLLLAGVMVGLAFNTKGFEAFVALPGIVAAYWFSTRLGFVQRSLHLAAFGLAALVVGLSWVTAVSLFPEDQRPIILNSDGNSIWSLTFEYNGIERVLGGGDGFVPSTSSTAPDATAIPLSVIYGGESGPLRLLGEFPGPLMAPAIPVALGGALILLLDLLNRDRRPAAMLWVPWLAAGLVVFSASRLGSPHYFESFSPAVAACIGAAAAAAVSGSLLRRAIALAGACGSAVYGIERLTRLGDAGPVIEVLAYATIAASAVALVAGLTPRRLGLAGAGFAPIACVLAVLFAMSYQAVDDAPIEGVQPGLVILAQDESRELRYDASATAYSFLTGNFFYIDPPVAYLKDRHQEGEYAAAVRSFYMAAAIISQQDLPVLPLYSEFRNRPELPVEKLQQLMDEGKVPYVLIADRTLGFLLPEAAPLIFERCPDDVSRAATVYPQTGLQLRRCGDP